MATDSVIAIRIDTKLKKQFEALCDDIGITMSSALIMFIKKSLKENRIPFDLTGKKYSKEFIQALKEALTQMNLNGPFDSVDDLVKQLDKQD